MQLLWFPPTGSGKDRTHFNSLENEGCFAASPQRQGEKEENWRKREDNKNERKREFEETLLETGFNLVAFSLAVFHSFREAEVKVCCVSPSNVMDFYKSFEKEDPLCNVGPIPCHVSKTPFKNKEGVIRVLKYCKDDEHFVENLPGLPLLLTENNHLNTFSENDPKCLSQYQDILPSSPSIFVHKDLRCQVFNEVDWKTSTVFRPMDVEIFASELHLTLPSDFCTEGDYARWLANYPPSPLPNRHWIYRVWEFLRNCVDDTEKSTASSEDSGAESISKQLSPLSSWCILPATEALQEQTPQAPCSMQEQQSIIDHFLVPLNKAESVIDFIDCGESGQKLVDILRNLGLPELNWPIFGMYSYQFARNLVSTLKSPHSLVAALKHKIERNPYSLENKLRASDAVVLLDYISRNTGNLSEGDKETLRKLPFYPTASGGLAKLEGNQVFLLPDIPKDGMLVVESKLGCLFLESRPSLSDLYKFLQVEALSPVKVYMDFLLKCFHFLSEKAKLAHLTYLRNHLCFSSVLDKKNEEIEKTELLERLKNVKVVPAKDGTWKTASNFYSPRNDVFFAMLPEDKFPPTPFDTDEWLPFLKKVGLVEDVSQSHFLTFARQVANEGETERTEKTTERSKVLVSHLISRPDAVGEGTLNMVCDIPFVVADPVEERLQALCPPYAEKKGDQIPFIAFKGAVVSDHKEIVWTKAHLLPTWADPRPRCYELGCPNRKIGQYLNDFLARLQVLKKPSVDLVVKHCQTLCSYLAVSNMTNKTSGDQRTVTEVMESIYTFLQNNAIKDLSAKFLLERSGCILVEEGSKFVLPRQAVLELYENLEIKPFLYRVPPEFGKFRSLFEYLGCSKYVKTSHYAMVLDMLQRGLPEG